MSSLKRFLLIEYCKICRHLCHKKRKEKNTRAKDLHCSNVSEKRKNEKSIRKKRAFEKYKKKNIEKPIPKKENGKTRSKT